MSAHRNPTISIRKIPRIQINIDSQTLHTLLRAILKLTFENRNRTVHFTNINGTSTGETVSSIKLRLNFSVMLVIKNDIHFISFP